MLRLLELPDRRELVSAEASDRMREHLLACDDRKKFPRLLPDGTKVAHKTGSVDGIRTDAGIIETPAGAIALCVLTSDNKDTRWADDNSGDLLCSRIARAAYEHFNPHAEKNASDCADAAKKPSNEPTRSGDRGWSTAKPRWLTSLDVVRSAPRPLQRGQGVPRRAQSVSRRLRDAHRGFPSVQPRPPAGGGAEEDEEPA